MTKVRGGGFRGQTTKNTQFLRLPYVIWLRFSLFFHIIPCFSWKLFPQLRGVIGIECESLHSIWRNKATEVFKIACKKGINVVVRLQYSEIRWLENSTFHSQLKIKKKSTPINICKKVQNFSNKWLKTTNLQLSQKSFKTCLRKLIIIATFIHRNNLLFYF